MNWQQELSALLSKVEECPAVKTSVDMLVNGVAKIACIVKDDAGAVESFATSLASCGAGDKVIANTPTDDR
jgi:hypothetical protein